MPAAELILNGISESGRGHVAELSIKPHTKALFPVKLIVDFGYGNQAGLRLSDFQSRLVAIEYSPGSADTVKYVGGYQITYVNPDGLNANRIIVVQRREFSAKVFNRKGNMTYSAREDAIAVIGVSGTKEDDKYRIRSSIKAGPMLIRQHEPSSPDTPVQNAIDLVVKSEAATIDTPLIPFGYEDDVLTLSDARPQSPLGIAINLDASKNFSRYDVTFPATSYAASLVIRNSKSPRTVYFDNRVVTPEVTFDGGGIMVNAEVRGWPPVLPSFMDATK